MEGLLNVITFRLKNENDHNLYSSVSLLFFRFPFVSESMLTVIKKQMNTLKQKNKKIQKIKSTQSKIIITTEGVFTKTTSIASNSSFYLFIVVKKKKRVCILRFSTPSCVFLQGRKTRR